MTYKDKLEELLKEFEIYGDLDGIQDIRPYMKAIENLIKGYKDSEDIMKQTVKENLEYKQYIRELEEKWDKDTHTLQNALDMANADKINNYTPKSKIKEIRDKAEVMDYYTLPDVIDDLNKLLEV